MIMQRFSNLLNKNLLYYTQHRIFAQKFEYQIPEKYRNSFYLANATLEDTTNWFIHNALGIIYMELIQELKNKGLNFFDAKRQISSVMSLLEPCNNFIDIRFPLKRKNGEYKIFRGYRAEHGLYIDKKPCLGGLRLCSKMQKSDIKALASLSTYKYAIMGIDLLGAHGGIIVSPTDVEEYELQKIIETYAKELTRRGFCGELTDIFEPDVNCGSTEMKWIIAANSKIRGRIGNACAVGKPEPFGGLKNREKAVAEGIITGLDVFLQNTDIMGKVGLEIGWKDKDFILQGLGSVGSYTASYLNSMGVACKGIIEHDCYMFDKKGINIREAIFYKSKRGTLDGFKNRTKTIEPNAVLTENCDMLILAATQKSLPYFLADNIRAKIIVEAANGPIAPSVHKIFLGHNKLVLPDIVINAASSISSYYEYLKNLQNLSMHNFGSVVEMSQDSMAHKFFSKTKHVRDAKRLKILLSRSDNCHITQCIDAIMEQTANDVIATSNIYNLDLDYRAAAYIIALKKLFWTAYKNSEIYL